MNSKQSSTVTTTMSTKMNLDLVKERSRGTFNVERITNFLDGGSSEQTARRRWIESIVRNDPTGIFDNSKNAYLSKQERHVRAIAKSVRMLELGRKLGILPVYKENSSNDNVDLVSSIDFTTLIASVADDLPLALHWVMFIPNILSLGDEEQQRLWIPRALNFEMIGCYAQTELGHGSNIRALETTATFTKSETSEDGAWIIHSPTITSTKFWPGTLGRTANHAMVIARLIDGQGVDRGIHNFLVPLRDLNTHKPLEGVQTGDVGPKIGFNNMDNGFCRFTNVKIPRRNMCMRFATVDSNGNYSKVKVPEAASRIAYITMMQVRAYIIHEAGKHLSMATTIAIRYSAVRRQGFSDASATTELQVLDYTQQQHRLLPLLAASYCFFFTGRNILLKLQQMERALVEGSNTVTKEQVSDMHASTSCVKSFTTTIAVDGIEECRRACGGHGFLVASGLPELLGTYKQNPTVEGDNHMLPQQTARVLLKVVQAVVLEDSSKLDAYRNCPTQGYLVDALQTVLRQQQQDEDEGGSATATTTTTFDLEFCLQICQIRTAKLLLKIAQQQQEGMASSSQTQQETWNDGLIEFARLSKAHSLAIILKDTMDGLKEEEESSSCLGPQEISVMMDLALLFGLYHIEKEMGDFLEFDILSSTQATLVRRAVLKQLKIVRPNAVSLVDARDYSDFRLKSALGKYDGNVYEALMETASKEPLNQTEPGPGYDPHLRKLIVDGVAAVPALAASSSTRGISGTVSRL